MYRGAYRTGVVVLVVTLTVIPLATGSVGGDISSVPAAGSTPEATGSSDAAQVERVNATQSQSQTITFIGPTDSRADYELSVTGELESTHGMGEEDSLSGSTADGAVWSGSDSYRYTGSISRIDASGDLDIVFDRTWHTITIEGREDSGRIDYSFSAEREVAAAQSIGEEDTIDGATVDGAVWSGSDTYRFSGDPDTVRDSLSVGDAATVYIDGERIGSSNSPASVTPVDDELTVSPGTSLFFEVPVRGNNQYIKWSINGEVLDQLGPGYEPFQTFYRDVNQQYMYPTFTESGTKEIQAASYNSDTDNKVNTIKTWTVNVEEGAETGQPPSAERISPDGPVRSTDDQIEFTIAASDPDGDLHRVIWWKSGCDEVQKVVNVDGSTARSTMSTDTGASCPVFAWVVDEHGHRTKSEAWLVE